MLLGRGTLGWWTNSPLVRILGEVVWRVSMDG